MIDGGSAPRRTSPSTGMRLTLIFIVPSRGGARLTRRPLLLQCTLDIGRHESAHIAAQPSYFLHQSRTDKRIFVLRHQENRLYCCVRSEERRVGKSVDL